MLRNFFQNKWTSFTILAILLCIETSAQNNPPEPVTWLRYQNQLQFSERLHWNNEVDTRYFVPEGVQQQFIVHSRVHYKISNWDFAGGLTMSWAYTQFPENAVDHPTLELRPVIETSYESKIGNVLLGNRLRLDNRLFEEDKFQDLSGEYNYVARFRYRLQIRFPLVKKEDKTLISGRLADEIMVNDRENFFDQNRIYASVETLLSNAFSLETGYIYIYQQRFGRDDFITRHVIRISLLHKIKLYQ